MTSLAVQDHIQYVRQPNTSIVEQVPSIPELNQWLLIEQRRKTQPYTVNKTWSTSTIIKVRQNQDSLDEEAKLTIVRNAHTSITTGVKDLDPSIRQLVTKNFKDLLWK